METNQQPEKDSLESFLAKQTEDKPFTMPPDDGSKATENNTANDDDDVIDLTKGNEHPKAEPVVKKRFVFDVEKTAEIIVDGLDGIQQAGFTLAYSVACFSKEDRQAIRALRQAYNAKGREKKEIVLNQQDLALMDEFNDFEDYNQTVLPLSDKEKEGLSSALCGLMEDMNFNPSPQKALLISSALIAIPRSLPILYKYVNKVINR